jgi:type IV pilus assembly protein PilV
MSAASLRGNPFGRQGGALLLQSLIAIALFSGGIVALLLLSATAVGQVSQAHYRASASLLAEKALAQMRLAGSDPGLRAAWAADGAAFLAWQRDVEAALPGAAALPPTLVIDADGGIVLTLRWRAPADVSPHQHVLATRMPI